MFLLFPHVHQMWRDAKEGVLRESRRNRQRLAKRCMEAIDNSAYNCCGGGFVRLDGGQSSTQLSGASYWGKVGSRWWKLGNRPRGGWLDEKLSPCRHGGGGPRRWQPFSPHNRQALDKRAYGYGCAAAQGRCGCQFTTRPPHAAIKQQRSIHCMHAVTRHLCFFVRRYSNCNHKLMQAFLRLRALANTRG